LAAFRQYENHESLGNVTLIGQIYFIVNLNF